MFRLFFVVSLPLISCLPLQMMPGPQLEYTVTDLRHASGCSTSAAWGVNNSGQVVGTAFPR